MADAILGLNDTNDFSSNRFKSWRRAILLSFPNGSAPLTALLSLTKPLSTADPEFNWFEKDMPTQTSTLSALYLAGATTIAVNDAIYRPGHIIKNLTTTNGEVMKVTAVNSTGKTLTVQRGDWAVTAEASSAGTDTIGIIGNANSEGSGAPKSQSFDPTNYSNFTQIFKSVAELTGTGVGTPVKWDPTGPWPEKLREALNFISIEKEKAFIWGEKAEYSNPTTGRIERTTDGVVARIPASNVILGTEWSTNNTITYNEWEVFMEVLFRKTLNNRQEKLALMGSGFAVQFNKMIKANATINILPAADTFGMKMTEYTSAHGTLFMKTHPLFSQISAWRNHCLFLDVSGIKYRYKNGRDLTRLPNVQLPDEDIRKDMFMAECGLETHHGDSHMLMKDVTASA